MTNRNRSLTRLAVIGAFVVFAGVTLLTTGDPGQRRRVTARKQPIGQAAQSKWKDFRHSTKAHQMECSSCHKFPSDNWQKVRDAKTAFPDITDYPKHESCLKCHQQQFFRGGPTPAICSNCHVSPGPRDSTRWPYPNPRELFDVSPKAVGHASNFVVGFPHDKHIEIVAKYMRGPTQFVNASYIRGGDSEASCAVCHQTMSPQGKSPDDFLLKPPANIGDNFWLKKGTFKSQPIGHTTCFTCHSLDSGLAVTPQTCNACHKLRPPQPVPDFDPAMAKLMVPTDNRPMLQAWATRHSSGKFPHEGGAHADLACATCHDVVKMNTVDPMSMRVNISSCATCHATAKSDDGGAINMEADQRKADPKFSCAKCHVTYGKQSIPVSHLKAIADAGK
jgi:hypothetical protein